MEWGCDMKELMGEVCYDDFGTLLGGPPIYGWGRDSKFAGPLSRKRGNDRAPNAEAMGHPGMTWHLTMKNALLQ